MSPSASEADTEQARPVDVVTPVVGLTAIESTVGLVFTTLTEAELLSLPLSLSAAVTAQVMVSPGEAVVVVRVTESLAPREVFCVSLVQV